MHGGKLQLLLTLWIWDVARLLPILPLVDEDPIVCGTETHKCNTIQYNTMQYNTIVETFTLQYTVQYRMLSMHRIMTQNDESSKLSEILMQMNIIY